MHTDFEYTSMVELLRYRAANQTQQRAFTFLIDGETDEAHLTYGELDRRARVIASWLQGKGMIGERILLLYPPGLDYIAAFFGCLYADCVAVPAYPPRFNRPDPRLQAIVSDTQAVAALTTQQILEKVARRFTSNTALADLQWLDTDTIINNMIEAWHEPDINGETLAFLQYTSGSTAAPKGVKVSHTNLLHNQRIIQTAFQHTSRSVLVGWLPLYHDMGLIGNMLQPLYVGFPCILMSPLAFLQKPVRWLQAISRYRATVSGGPNFAYDFCVDRISPQQRENLDLSSWQVAFNGAEFVRPETLERFLTAFEPYGFQQKAFFPCYGLAEATLMVTGGPTETVPVLRSVQDNNLVHNHLAAVSLDEMESRPMVSCGPIWLDQKILIVDPESSIQSPPGQIGEIWISGPSVAQGYWNKPAETNETFRAYLADTGEGPFLRTGDLGFLENGELFIAGRLKDLIIIRGNNYYPQDIELAAEQSHFALQPGSGAAFSVEVDHEEQVVLVYEVKRQHRNINVNEVARAVREVVAQEFELQVYAIVLVKTGTILKTTSGKIQRNANKQQFLANSLAEIGRSILDTAFVEEARNDAPIVAFTPTQKKLADIWAEVLQVEQVGIHDNFFALGGHSLLATQLLSRMREAFQIDFSLYTIFEFPTIAELAGKIEETRDSEDLADIPAILSVSREKILPLSFSQERMWFLYQFEPNNVAYHVPIAIRLVGLLNIGALEGSFNEVVRRHEVLRTIFANVDGRPVQVIIPTLSLNLPVVDLRAYPPVQREAEVRRSVFETSKQPFDMAKGPLLRLTLYQLGAEEYVVLLVMHHIISDAWSLSLLWQEVAALYTTFLNEEPSSLPNLPLQYADFAYWQRQSVPNAYFEEQLAYWKQQLAGAPLVLELPTDRPRPAIQTSQGSYMLVPLPPLLLESLRKLSQQEDATLFMTILAAFKVLLYRYTGQEDILVGAPIANRHWLAVEKLIGSFVNTLVMRTDLSGDPTFWELVERVRKMALAAFDHQDLSFEHLVEELQPERDLSHPPLIQVMFSAANPPLPVVQLPDLTWNILEFDRGAAQFDLTLALVDTKQIQLMKVEYNTDLFDHATIERMMTHLQVLLEGIVATGGKQRLSDLPLLSEVEKHRLLVEWNETVEDYPADTYVHQLFETQVKQTPDAVAAIFAEDQITYSELNRRANQLAHYLRTLGVGPDVYVGICMERSLDMLVGLLGILKAGGAYVPLDPAYPQQRLVFMLEDLGSPVLVTQTQLLDNFPGFQGHTVCIDANWDTVGWYSEQNFNSGVSSENLAYIIYTSGSTGIPKGVEIPHKAMVNFLSAMQQLKLTNRDTLLAVTTLSFDISVLELFLPLITGARLVLVGRDEAADGTRLIQRLADVQATIMQATPTTWRLLLQAGWEGSDCLTILCGGEALPRELADQLLGKSACVLNMYGPTETTIWSTMSRVEAGDGPVGIGRPLSNTQIYVLDAHLQPVPVGVPGELYIGGDGLARGYHNRPELTAEKFVTNPFSDKPDSRLYKTGDLVCYRVNGDLEFLGRIDHQVKLHGFRIELGEIETVLAQHPAVQQVVVVVSENATDDKRIVAYIVPNRAETPSVGELRRFLDKKFPHYMIPSVFMILDIMPLTPNGKINRKALPVPDLARPELEQRFVSPATDIEIILAEIWSELLQVDQVGIYDNFFDLGGHSLLITQVMSRVNKAFQIDIPLRTFFVVPTIYGLANVIEEKLIAEIDDLTETQAEQLLKETEHHGPKQ